MAGDSSSIITTLSDYWNKLPASLNGTGTNFIYLLKNMLSDLTSELNTNLQNISKIYNTIAENSDKIDKQLKNCKVEEKRVGTAITLTLSWDSSDVENYNGADIYIKRAKGDSSTSIDWSTVDTLASVTTTKTNSYILSNVSAGYVYHLTFLGRNTYGGVSKEGSAPTLTYVVSALNNVPDAPSSLTVQFNRDGVLWKWTQPVDLDYAYAELRENGNAGVASGLLEITQDTTSTMLPSSREGVAYLFNKGYGYRYSNPATVAYSKPIPISPPSVTITKTFQGLTIKCSDIPEDCIGAVFSINGLQFKSQNNEYTYFATSGNFTIKVCYYDIFGNGNWSESQTTSTIQYIDPDWVKEASISGKLVHITEDTLFDKGVIIASYIGDKAIVGTKIADGAISTITLAANAVTAGKIASNAITTDKLDADAVTADKITSGAITTDKLDANAVTADKLDAGSVTADKLAANEIDMAGALKIVGGAVTLDENGLKTLCSNGSYVLHNGNGITFIDTNGLPFSGMGRFCTGAANDGNTVTFANPWDVVPSVFLFPTSLQTNSTDYTSTSIYQQVMPTNISKNGFKVICRSIMKSGSGSNIAINNQFANWNGMVKDSGGVTYSKAITFPSSATTFNGNVTISCTSKHTAAVAGNNGSPAVAGQTYADIQWSVDGRVVESMHQVLYVFGSAPNGASNSINISKSISLSNNTNVTVTVRFRGGHSGDGSGDLSTPTYSSGNAIFNSYSVNTNQDTVIATGQAGFIAVDPNTVPYTIS